MRQWIRATVCFCLCVYAANDSAEFVLAQTPAPSAAQQPAGNSSSGAVIAYVNWKYGFTFFLPESWRGFQALECQWSGDPDSHGVSEYGATISIREPLYTRISSGGEIPIMVFTKRQWRDVEAGNLNVSAGPFSPDVIGQNRKYVFAMQFRFDYDDLDSLENAREFFAQNPLRASRIKRAMHGVGDEQASASECRATY